MKVGVNLKINVSEILKQHLYEGKKGKYLDMVAFIDVDEKDQFGNSGMIKQDWQGADKNETPILGNARVFWSDSKGSQQQAKASGYNQQQPNPKAQQQEPNFDYDDTIPF